jgi:hypothetical protein
MHVDPFRRAERDIGVHRVLVPVLDDVQVLDAQQVAGPHHGTGIVRLVDVLQNAGHMPRALQRDALEERTLVRCDEFAEALVDLGVGHFGGKRKAPRQSKGLPR